MRRVVITGMAALTPIGLNWETVKLNLMRQKTGIQYMRDWDKYRGLNTRLAAPVDFTKPDYYSRKQLRGMGRVAIFAVYATELALIDAGLLNDPCLTNGSTGVSYGSSSGSFDGLIDFTKMLLQHDTGSMNATSYIRMMGHTAPVNIALHFGINGRILPTSTACTSGSLGIGYAYETIKYGMQDVMIAGGSDELSPSQAAVFDTLFATSTHNDQPEKYPRPFDIDRDGLVIGEGAGTFILEERNRAVKRGAKIIAEIVGFGTNSDGLHVTQPNSDSMQIPMRLALNEAQIEPSEIGYLSAHGTSTEQGDIAESQASSRVYGKQMMTSSMKSYTGHTLGACGAVEAWAALHMMHEGWFHPTANLETIDPLCGSLDYIKGNIREKNCRYVVSNNFAFGGINTSLIFKRGS
jgi:3-oxoacyl-[acyl-carrier-protein] synthase II